MRHDPIDPVRGKAARRGGEFGMALFPDIVIPAPYRLKTQRDLRRVSLDLEYERRGASVLK